MIVKLKLTRAKPNPVIGEDRDGNVIAGEEYLYTTNGRTNGWFIALKLLIKNKEALKKEITIDITLVEKLNSNG